MLPDGITAESFGDNTVTDGTNFYATLSDAVIAIDNAKLSGAILYCKPNANVGSLQHAPVCSTLTIYGNGATVAAGGNQDFDIGNTDPNGGRDVTADMTLTVYNLNGCGAWGTKATEHTVSLVFVGCKDMGEVFISGTVGTLNISLTNCSFTSNVVSNCKVYSNANGNITLNGVEFSNVDKAVNLNHKVAGTQEVVLTNCTFTNCGNNVTAGTDEIPVRVLSSVEDGYSNLTVSGCEFTGTPEGGADILLDYGVGTTNASVSSTSANVTLEKEKNVGSTTVVASTDNKSFSNVEVAYVAKVNGVGYESFADALAAAKAMTGDVEVEIYEKVTLNAGFSGSFTSITFVGKDTDAEIYLDLQGYAEIPGKIVAFKDLKLSKVAGGYVANAGFMNLAFGIYGATEVSYDNCVFANGAYAATGKATFTGCDFYSSHDRYSFWAYGDDSVITIDNCDFVGLRGIKMYSENHVNPTIDLTVKNTDFTAADGKPAIVLTYGTSVTLENNVYPSKGVFELDLDGKPNGVSVTSKDTITCINDNGACGVLVDGKIYTTVAQAAEVAVEGSKVTLLYNSTETVEFMEGVTLDKNGYEASNVTVKKTVAAIVNGVEYRTLVDALKAVTSDNDTVTVLCDVTENLVGTYLRGNIVTENGAKVTITLTNSDWVYLPYTFVIGENVTLKAPALFYYAGGGTINGTVITDAYYQRYANTKLTINEPGSMTVTGETFIVRYMDGDPDAGIYINGDNDDSTVGLKASVIYFYQGTISAKDANIVAGVYWQTNETDGQGSANLILDNSTLTVTVNEHDVKATGNSTVTLVNGSSLNSAGGVYIPDTTDVIVDSTSSISDKNGNVVIKVLKGEGTAESPYIINSLAQLEWFRDDVNSGNTYDNKYVKLTNSIDLENVAWTPIGNSTNKFLGTFDGDNNTISNLYVNVATNNAGLFGFASVVKNVKICNANVTGVVSVGALVGELESSVGTIDNCHVSGNIQITGQNSVGGLAGKGYANIKNSSVIGNGTSASYVLGVYGDTEEGDNIGGIIGHLGEGNTLGISNSKVENIKIAGTRKVGGIVGTTARANDYVGNTVKNLVIECTATAEYADENASTTTIGGIIGNYFGSATSGGILNNSSVSNVQFIVGNAKSAGALVGGDRVNNGGAPVGVESTGSSIDLSTVTGVTNYHYVTVVAQIGDTYYATLAEAIAAVEENGIITLIGNITYTEETRTHNSGTWYDGLYYVGDKSFTIDLGGFTISQNGAVNDYLLNFKNVGSKANTITIKNGTIDAGTAAYCALCTSATQENQLTINLEEVELINNISNGSTIKIRGGAILNVKDGTVITGKNSYLGIECIASTVNIYDGAEIYMNGTSSYNGCLVGVGSAGTVNVYGGYGKGVKGGFIAMTSGGTINIFGGEWIANTDGTVGNNSNLYVLTAQSNKYESGFAGPSIINIKGGTLRGGMDAWVLNNLEGEKAEINISGGNFNVNPTRYIVAGYIATEANGVYTVAKAVAQIGNTYYATLQDAIASVQEGQTIVILAGTIEEGTIKLPATLKNVTIKGAEGAILKDTTISAADGNSYSYIGLTFDGITFDNSRIVLTGWRNGEETIENLTITNCTFKNINDTSNNAAVHINKDASEAVNGFTFTNNVIDGATGGSKSGVYAQLTGNVVFTNNTINNVSFRPFVIQITTDDGIADSFVVTGNTFSGSAVGRAQGLGNNAEGTDSVTLVVSENIFKDITDSQQICYWNFNAEKTTADLSGNYYDIDVLANPSKIYFNGAAEDASDLVEMGIFPIYTALNEDGTINTESAFTPVVLVGSNAYATIEEAFAAAQSGDTITLLADVSISEVINLTNANVNIAGNYTLTLNDNLKVFGETTLNISCKLNGEVWLDDGAILKDSTINGDVFVAGNVTFRGTNTVNMVYDFGELQSNYGTSANMAWKVEEGSSLKIVNKARYGLGYGDSVTIYGTIEDALTARETLTDGDVAFFVHGIVAQESKGWNKNSSLTVKDAYVVIGSNNSFGNKPGNYGGNYVFTFNNVVLTASRITFYEALSKTEFNFTNSDVVLGTFMTNDADSVFTLTNTKLLATNTTNGNDEGNYNAGILNLVNSILTYSAPLRNNGTIKLDINSVLTAPSIVGNGKFVIDVSGFNGTATQVINADMSGFTGEIELVNGRALHEVTVDGVSIKAAPVAQIGDTYYTTLEEAFKAATSGCTITILEDVTIDYYWDARNTGAKFTVPVTIDGNGKTITFTNTVYDGGNYMSAFRFEADATVKNLTIDMSEALSGFAGRFRAISAKGNLTVDNCTFIGNGSENNTRAIIFGEGATEIQTIQITNSTFTGWRRAISDNEGGNDTASSVVVNGNTFTDASVYVSASENITFNNNVVNGDVDLRSYNNLTTVNVEALGNTLDATKDNEIKANPENVNAQSEFATPVAQIDAKYYYSLQDAIAAAKAGETVTILAGNYTIDIDVNKAITVAGAIDAEGNNLVNITGRVSVSSGAKVMNLNVHNDKTGDYDCALVVNGKDIVIDGVNLTGYNGMRYCYANGNITIKNSEINATNFAVHFDGKSGANIAFENCDITGWCSYASTVNSVSYTNCDLDNGNSAGHRYYNKNISFNECTFSEGMKIDLKSSGTTVTFTDSDMTISDVKSLFKEPYYVAKGNITLNGSSVTYVASAYINGTSMYFDSLQECIDAIPEGKNLYVTIRSNIVLTETLVIPEGKKLTIGLSGFSITQEKACTESYEMILNKGDLTIEGSGKISFKDTGAGDPNFNWGSYTVRNEGTLTITNNAVIEHLGAQSFATHMICAIQQTKGTTTINSGTISTPNYRSVRINRGEMIINGGTFDGQIWVQAYDNSAKLTVNGGTFEPNGYDASSIFVQNVTDNNVTYNVTFAVTNGTFNGKIGASNAAKLAGAVTGGLFTETAKNGTNATLLGAGLIFGNEANANGYYGLTAGLKGSGTEADPYQIGSLEDLIFFRDSVNAGETRYNAKGVYVALTANIDMASVDWSVNIGDDCNATFDGIFDGKGYTIYNLNSTETAQKSDGYICTGLFGAIYGSAVIKNLTITNVTINTGNFTGNNAGAVVGFAYNCTGSIENVIVTNATINAAKVTGVGAIVGYDYYGKLTISGCEVNGATINGKSYVGGVVGYLSSNATITGCTVENTTISATASAAGIAGIALGGVTVKDSTVKNVTVSATGELWANSAAIAVGTITANGPITVSNITVDTVNVTAMVGGKLVEKPTEPIKSVQAKIGNVYYATLQGALNAANADDTVELLAPVVVAKGETLEIDKNVTITYTSNVAGEDMITVYGDLIISAGTITYTNTDTTGSNVTVSTISVGPCGTLVVNGGVVENKTVKADGSSIYSYAIDMLTNGNLGDVTVTINGGTIYSDYMAIRQFNNGDACKNTLVVNDGYIYGAKRAIQVHFKNNAAYLTISGGKIEADGDYTLCLFPTNATNIAVTGGTFVGAVYSGTNGFITGGTFSTDVSDYVAEGHRCVVNSDGTYTIKKLFKVLGTNVYLDTDLSIDFIYDGAEFNGTDYYAVIKKCHAENCACEATTYYLSWNDFIVEESGYVHVKANGIAAKEMVCDIEVVIYKGTFTRAEDGTVTENGYAVSQKAVDSVVKYAERGYNYYKVGGDGESLMTDAARNAYFVTLADMLVYGAEAQQFFGHYVGIEGGLATTVNDTIKEIVAGYATPSTFTPDLTYEIIREEAEGTAYFAGANIDLENTIFFNLYFINIDFEKKFDAKIVFTHHSGETHEYSISAGTLNYSNNAGYLQVNIDDLAPADLRLDVECIITVEGEQVSRIVISVEDYLATIRENDPDHASMYNAVINYADSAEKYFYGN